jgi:hypothetical protein
LIDPDLLAFIRASVPSVWALELLLLIKQDSGRAWQVEPLVQEMRASTPAVAHGLTAFEAAGLVQHDGAGNYRYAPAGSALARLADQLEAAYRERPGAIVKAILSSPNEKLQSFADAFRFKGDST